MSLEHARATDALLTIRDLEARWSVGTTTRCEIMKDPSFPEPVRLPGMGKLRNRRWKLEDIVAFEEATMKATA